MIISDIVQNIWGVVCQCEARFLEARWTWGIISSSLVCVYCNNNMCVFLVPHNVIARTQSLCVICVVSPRMGFSLTLLLMIYAEMQEK